MSSFGELYILEDCTDTFEEKLNKAFGEENWRLDCSKYRDVWNENEFPLSVELDVLDDDTDEKIGEVEITSKHKIEYEYEAHIIRIIPQKIKILQKVKKK